MRKLLLLSIVTSFIFISCNEEPNEIESVQDVTNIKNKIEYSIATQTNEGFSAIVHHKKISNQKFNNLNNSFPQLSNYKNDDGLNIYKILFLINGKIIKNTALPIIDYYTNTLTYEVVTEISRKHSSNDFNLVALEFNLDSFKNSYTPFFEQYFNELGILTKDLKIIIKYSNVEFSFLKGYNYLSKDSDTNANTTDPILGFP
jgi:hypothetical protein